MSRLQAVPDEPSFKYPDNPIGIERARHARVQPPSKPGLKVLKLLLKKVAEIYLHQAHTFIIHPIFNETSNS